MKYESLVIAIIALFMSAQSPSAQGLRIPAGTMVYGELDEKVTTRVKHDGTSRGDIVQAHVWRDVVIDGRTVIPAGSPMLLRVSRVRKSNFAGVKGRLELRAISVTLDDGTEVPLSGGYDKKGSGHEATSISLAAVVAWPLVFIKGGHANLEAGTIFDARVMSTVQLRASAAPRRTISLQRAASLSATVDYNAMSGSGGGRLPLRLEACDGASVRGARVVSVNNRSISPVGLATRASSGGGSCETAMASLELDRIKRHLAPGINRFEVEADGQRSEVVLDVEL